MHSLARSVVSSATTTTTSTTLCYRCRRPATNDAGPSSLRSTPKSPPSSWMPPAEARDKFVRDFLSPSPYQLPEAIRRHLLLQRTFYACLAGGGVYGFCRLWEAHQARKSDPDSLHPPLWSDSGSMVQRWILIGPYSIALCASSCVFALWRLFGVTASGVGGGFGGLAMTLRGATLFLRLLVDRPGLGKSMSIFSRPLLSPFGAALSHNAWAHFLMNQLILFGCVTSCIGKQSPGEFVSFCITAAYFSSLASLVVMCVTNQFVYCIGASGVLSALVAYNALTSKEGTDRVWQALANEEQPGAALVEQPRLALFGILPLPASISPGAGIAAWAAVEAALLARAALWLRRPPRFNHAAHLAGIAFGVAYAWGGHRLLWSAHPVPPLKPPPRSYSSTSPASVSSSFFR